MEAIVISSIPSPTVIRIKRRLEAESAESILVFSKRKRSEEDEAILPESCTSLLKKFITLEKDVPFEQQLKKVLENEPKHSWDLKKNYKMGFNPPVKDLVRKQRKADVADIRFKLICSKRHIQDKAAISGEDGDKDSSKLQIQVFDALREGEQSISGENVDQDIITCNGLPLSSEKVKFVYDLYYTSLPIEFSSWIDNICEIQKHNAIEYVSEKVGDKSSDENDDDDDENDEDNWRNDYPDEDDDQLLHEDDDEENLSTLMTKTKIYDSEESYDADEYEESGNFDEDGNLILDSHPTNSVFKTHVIKQAIESESSDVD